MKKMLVALLALLMVLSFGACFNKENAEESGASSDASKDIWYETVDPSSEQESSEEETSDAESIEEESSEEESTEAGNSTSDWVDIEFPRPQ